MYTPVISCSHRPLAALPLRKASWTYRSTGSPSRPWRHSVALRRATAAASWCRSPTAAPASSPSPAWSHCHSQSSSLMSPPANGPHRTELHSGHDAYGHDGGRKWWECQMYTNVWSHDSRQWWAIMNHISFIQTGDWWQTFFFSFPQVTVILASLKPFWLTTRSAWRTIFLNQHFYFEADERWRGTKEVTGRFQEISIIKFVASLENMKSFKMNKIKNSHLKAQYVTFPGVYWHKME